MAGLKMVSWSLIVAGRTSLPQFVRFQTKLVNASHDPRGTNGVKKRRIRSKSDERFC